MGISRFELADQYARMSMCDVFYVVDNLSACLPKASSPWLHVRSIEEFREDVRRVGHHHADKWHVVHERGDLRWFCGNFRECSRPWVRAGI